MKGIIGRLNDIEVKQKAFSDKLIISKDDFSVLMQLAKKGESKLLENISLKAKVNTLTEDRDRYKSLKDSEHDELYATQLELAKTKKLLNNTIKVLPKLGINLQELQEELKEKELNSSSKDFDRDR